MVQALFLDAHWEGSLKYNQEVADYLKDNNIKTVALFASVNFLQNDDVKEQLEAAGITVLKTRAKRTHKEGQVLGCDSYHDSYKENIIDEADLCMYIGDGMFHPEALLFSQMYKPKETRKDVFCWNPVDQKIQIISAKDIESRRLKTKSNLMKYMLAKKVGILVTLKPGQRFLELAHAIKKQCEEQGKQAYIFVDNTFEYKRMEDYQFIDVWVNTACPRIGQDDNIVAPRPLVNAADALQLEKALERLN